MADFVLTLGGVGFQDFEVPDSIRAGGKQALALRKYAGGVRTIDTMGPDDAPLRWSGWFEGPDAQQRCQQLDVMRRQGVAVVCAWSSYSYLVVIRGFDWDFRRFYHIAYSLELEVVQDQSYPPQQGAPDGEQQMQSDALDAGSSVGTLPAAPPIVTGQQPIPTGGVGWGINNP